MNKDQTTSSTFIITDFVEQKQKVLNWSKRFNTFCFLDNHQYQLQPHSVECIMAAGVRRYIKSPAGKALDELQHFINNKKSWLFGHLGYDLKNEIESLSSSHPHQIAFPDLYFFEPEIIIRLSENKMIIEAEDPEAVFSELENIAVPSEKISSPSVLMDARISREDYMQTIENLRQHILRGDCYEINFCQEFFATDIQLDPVQVYKKLSALSPNPFSALYKVNDQWLICASPERFIKKTGSQILSQPIKGTVKREVNDIQADEYRKKELYSSAKDRSENVMVVDLVRNDLSRICEEGSVQVDELYGIYSFPQVHQMISTVSGTLKDEISFVDIIRACFPMGSMTGAPKKRVMELIEKYEKSRRGIFSGALGYISPSNDFDFNVVIRSIMYNAANKYLSYQVGSGITFYSDPENEWEECMLKAAAIKTVLAEEEN